MNRLLTIVDSKYQRLEYLESTGTQYIDTGIVPSANIQFVCDVAFTDISVGRFGMITEPVNPAYRFYFGVVSSKFVGANSQTYNHSVADADTNRHVFSLDNTGLSIDNVLVYSNIGTYATTNLKSLYLFACNDNGNASFFAKAKQYNSQIYDNGTLVRNFVPVLRKTDNELGMLDLVEGKFYPNAGTGKFTANLDTMYAIIQGSPTQSPYGVFSGFSSSNYLQIKNINFYQNTSFEYNIAFLSSNVSSTENILNCYSLLIKKIYSKIQCFVRVGGSQTEIIGTTTLSNNQLYYVRVRYTLTTVDLYLSTDGKNYNLENSINVQIDNASNNTIQIGYETETIDLNRSYIKIGSTKYNLQAVVGYTVVGSPTITDGVVSGFQAYPNVNSGYYVKIANFTYNNTFEMKVKIKTDSANFGGTVLGQGNPAPRVGIGSTSFRESNFTLQLTDQNNQSIVNIVNVNYIDSRQLTLNTDYILSLKFIGTEYIITLVDMNGIYYINRVVSSSAKLRVGCLAFGVNYADVAYSAWSGAIDMNETWIKTDNKLFFNGQQA